MEDKLFELRQNKSKTSAKQEPVKEDDVSAGDIIIKVDDE